MLRDLVATPAWFAFARDPATDRTLLVQKNEEEYRADSFLDQRSLRPDTERMIVPWQALTEALSDTMRADPQYIFHIGHVGSTLISRLLGEIESVFALREPLLLRTLAEAPAERRDEDIKAVTQLLGRTFRAEQRAIVKATSFTSEIAHRLLPAESRALFLFATPRHYIQNILAGDASREELHILAPVRDARLRRRCTGVEPAETGEAALAALAWACEMTSLEQSAAQIPADDLMWLDFDRFLVDPAAHLVEIARFFGHPITAETAAALCSGPLMRRYSKAPEYDYSPSLRREILAEAGSIHANAIEDALGWLERAAERHPMIARAIARSA